MKLCSSCQKSFASIEWICPHCGFEPQKVDGFLSFAPELAYNNDGFPADGFDRLVRLESGNFWFRSRSKLILWALAKYFKTTSNFLEIGCGNGYVLSCIHEKFPDIKLFGSEVYQQGLHHASQRIPAAQFFQMDARAIPFENYFNSAGAFDVLEHIPEDEKVLASLFRSVSTGGGILITVPQHRFLWTYADQFAGHVRRYSSLELKEKAEKAGFKVENVISFVSLLLPLMLLSRWLQGNNPKKYNPEAELHINPIMNFILEKTLDFERLLIRLGLRFPWGGSLLLVARKEKE
ncbi:MAG TPA: class I SAM-dependent methyltransferase [bacterium]|jgi:SAM-dependent methyltransferase|nr:class I SAM-dependent methyltransferase [bacterium]